VALANQDKLEEAVACYRRALESKSNCEQAFCELCATLLRQKKPEEAETAARRFLELEPDSAIAHGNLAAVFADQDRFDDAEACFQRALEIEPKSVQTYRNLATLLVRQNKLEAAVDRRVQALAIDPMDSETHFGQALGLLQLGRFEPGWREYEWRFRRQGKGEGNLPQPRWDGSPLAGRTILLRAEQGLGDTLQFVRYAEFVKAKGAKVIVECPRQLARLVAGCAGVDEVVVEREPRPPFDVHIPLLSLPNIFNTSLDSIPNRVPYLTQRRRQCGDGPPSSAPCAA
jgi:tetratricopeptide (TPR) repeat protein